MKYFIHLLVRKPNEPMQMYLVAQVNAIGDANVMRQALQNNIGPDNKDTHKYTIVKTGVSNKTDFVKLNEDEINSLVMETASDIATRFAEMKWGNTRKGFLVSEENKDDRFSEEAQDIFNEYYDEVETELQTLVKNIRP